MRRAAKRDDNEAVIVTALQSAGWTVVRVSDSGAPDLICVRMGDLRLVEVKGPKGTLTPAQEVAFERLNKAGVTVLVVRSPADALEALGVTCYDSRYVAENGAFLCESCWLPEDGLHAKDCPTRQALKVPGKVKSAYRAAKEDRDVLPKRITCWCHTVPGRVCGACKPGLVLPPRGVEGELQPLARCRAPKCKLARGPGKEHCHCHWHS